MKCAGLIGGMSWESTALYYQWINTAVRERLGGLHSASLLLYSVDFAEIEGFQRRGDWSAAAASLVVVAEKLQAAGADFLVICTNTMHKVADQVQAHVQIPLLHIVDPTAHAIRAQNVSCVGLLGTAFTMADDFYISRLERTQGVSVIVPDPDIQADIHRIIYEELCVGKITDSARSCYLNAVQLLTQAGAQGVILGCTEITLLIDNSHTSIPLFDTTKLHAHAVVDRLLESSNR